MRDSESRHSTTLYGVLHALEDALVTIQVFEYRTHNYINVPVDVSFDDARSTIESLTDDLMRIRDDLRGIVGESFHQGAR